MVKTDLPAIASPGARPLKKNKHEKYCRLRAALVPRVQAWREAGWGGESYNAANVNAIRFERRPAIRERLAYLSRQAEDLIAAKRQRLESQLWEIAEADIGNYFETVETAKSDRDGKLKTDPDGKMLTARKQRPKLLSDLSLDQRKLIEDLSIDRNGNYVPRLYSRTQANAALCKLLNIGAQTDRPESDISRLSDAELIKQLGDQAKELGVEINLSYDFHQKPPPAETDERGSPVLDNEGESDSGQVGAECSAVEAADAATAAELKVAAQPAVAGARPVRAARPKHRS